MGVARYRHKSKSFHEKFAQTIFMNKGRMKIPKDADANFVRNSLISSLFILAKSIEEESQWFINHMDVARCWTLE